MPRKPLPYPADVIARMNALIVEIVGIADRIEANADRQQDIHRQPIKMEPVAELHLFEELRGGAEGNVIPFPLPIRRRPRR